MSKTNFREIVEEVLKTNERARIDGTILLIEVWRRYTKLFVPNEALKKLPKPETIFREKRDIMNKENKYNEKFVPEEGISYEHQ